MRHWKIEFLKRIDRLVGKAIDLCQSAPRDGQMPEKISQIAIIKQSAMGDAWCLMPAIRLLKKQHPDASILWCTSDRTVPQLFSGLDFIDKILIIPISWKLLPFFLSWRKEKIDVCIDADQYYQSSHLLAFQAEFSSAFQTPAKPKRTDHVSLYLTEENEKKSFVRLVTSTFGKEMPPRIDPTLSELAKIYQFDEEAAYKRNSICKNADSKIVVLYPNYKSSASFRSWSKENFICVAKSLCEQGFTVCIAGGPEELETREYFDQLTPSFKHYHNLINQWRIEDWFLFLHQDADLFVGGDAGLLHVAEAAGVPSIGIFGPGMQAKWESIQKRSRSVSVGKRLPCQPCIRPSEGKIPSFCARGDQACLERISAELVLNEVYHFFKTADRPRKNSTRKKQLL